jgi:hypothetical protein
MLEPFRFLSFCLYACSSKQLNFSQDRFTTLITRPETALLEQVRCSIPTTQQHLQLLINYSSILELNFATSFAQARSNMAP